MSNTLVRTLNIQGKTPHTAIFSIGQVLNDRFRLDRVLGTGGMSVVYGAHDLVNPEISVAIKAINPEFQRHPAAFMTLQAEALKARKLRHPNIVEVYDFDINRADNTGYITMEYLNGVTLTDWLNNSPHLNSSARLRKQMVSQIAQALHYAHEKGCVHADLKPGNIFIETTGNIKIFDFGLANVLDPNQPTAFDPTLLYAYTPAYSSADVLQGEKPQISDDIYSFACIAYELLMGEHPYQRQSAIEVEKLSAVKKLALPTSLNPQASQWLLRALKIQRTDRPQNLSSFIQSLNTPMAWWKRFF